MIIFCAGPIRGIDTYKESLKKIIEYVEGLGNTVLSEFSTKFSSTIPLTEKQIYKRDLKWIDGSKCMIAEISGPSLGVGFEISYAVLQRKLPVLAVHNSDVKEISAMLLGCDSPFLTIQKYRDDEDLKKIVKDYLTKIK